MLLLCNYKSNEMKIPVIRIGNSKGILLSKTLIERYGIGEKIEMIMQADHIELKPVSRPRQDWEKAFQQMHQEGDDLLHDEDMLDDDILEEWK